MMVHGRVLRIIVRRREQSIPIRRRPELVGHDHHAAARVVALLVVGVVVVLAQEGLADTPVRGLVDDLDAQDHVVVGAGAVFALDLLQDRPRALRVGIPLFPAWGRAATARVVEAVLAAGDAVEVDEDFEVDLAGPGDLGGLGGWWGGGCML